MPRKKIYLNPRTKLDIRIDTDIFEQAQIRAEEKKMTFTAYITKIIEDDLILAQIENQQLLIKKMKEEKLRNGK